MSEPGESASHEFPREQNQGSLLEVLWVSTRLGLTSFGSPIAHLGYFHQEYVKRKQWIDEQSYADLVALCQFLPGPASSQVGIAIGIARAGLLGGVAAWLGFTLPSALALIVFGLGIGAFADAAAAGWLHGLKIVAVAVVAQAVWGMGSLSGSGPGTGKHCYSRNAHHAGLVECRWAALIDCNRRYCRVGVFSRHRFF